MRRTGFASGATGDGTFTLGSLFQLDPCRLDGNFPLDCNYIIASPFEGIEYGKRECKCNEQEKNGGK